MRHFRPVILRLLLVLGLVLSGVSPACKFISGQSSFIEICTALGLAKIPAPEDGAGHRPDHKEQCPFCLFAHGGAALAASGVAFPAFPVFATAGGEGREQQVSPGAPSFSYDSRAPPRFS